MATDPIMPTDDALQQSANPPQSVEETNGAPKINPTEQTEPETIATESETTTEAETQQPQVETEAIPAVVETAEEAIAEPEVEQPVEDRKLYNIPSDKEGIVARLAELSLTPEETDRNELDQLKHSFYRYILADQTAAREAYIEAGGDPETFTPQPEPLEPAFKEKMAAIRQSRARAAEEAEQQKTNNLARKQKIVEDIKKLATTPEDANKNYDAFRRLQDAWKSATPVPAPAVAEAWKTFHVVVENYYDLLKENNALREYDFKKNLEAKTLLCEAAEKLADEPDVIHAVHQLQQLHQEYREIGPVAKELREALWARFKEASTIVNRRHAKHFDELKAQEKDNLVKKTALCEAVEEIQPEELKNFTAWNETAKKIIDIQAQWRKIGHAPKKDNVLIYERFRAACDIFFSAKAQYFKELNKTKSENIARRVTLCEAAEALKDSTDWNATTQQFLELQKEWRTIGFIPQRQSNALWERFNAACRYFFEQKKQVLGAQQEEQSANLAAKREIIEQLKALLENETADAAQQARELMNKWNQIGHVPYRAKEKINARYREVTNEIGTRYGVRRDGRSMPQRHGGQGGGGVNSLIAQYEAKKAELATYENNISFLTTTSKSGNALINQMNQRMEALKAELQALVERIKAKEAGEKESKNIAVE